MREGMNEEKEKEPHQKTNVGQKSDRLFYILALVAVVIANIAIQINYKSPEVIQTVADSLVQARPSYVLYGKNVDGGHLKHVIAVLDRLGFERKDNVNDSWDLLWAHDYPFGELKSMLSNLESYRKVNHLPGNGHITNKVDLAVTKNPYIPRAFQLPQDKEAFLAYSKENPDAKFVQKHNQHRHIYIRDVDEIDFTDHNSFVQEYIQKPFLVDGHKFDIGVYVIITSIDPLRIYMYKGEILFRYCPNKYYPFNETDQDKYVVGDAYLPSWKVPALEGYHTIGFGMKNSFDAYVRSMDKDPEVIWDHVEDAIASVILQQEDKLKQAMKHYQFRTSFFEMMRFDLIIDDDLQVYLLESNMSPNLSSMKFPPNAIIYEQLLYNMFALLGISSTLHRESFKKLDTSTEIMISSLKHLVVEPDHCNAIPCSESCAPEECTLCMPCLNSYQLFDLHTAYREHINRQDTRRIFPKPIKNLSAFNATASIADLSARNQWMSKWFLGKCKLDVTWCT